MGGNGVRRQVYMWGVGALVTGIGLDFQVQDWLKTLPHWRSPRLKMSATICSCLRVMSDKYHLSPTTDHAHWAEPVN